MIPRFHPRPLRLSLLLTSALLVTSVHPASPLARTATAQEADTTRFQPQIEPRLDVRRASGSIEIDGDLGDPGWNGAARASGFSEVEPDEMARPPVRTEAWVTYDEEHLYVAFLAHDDPDQVRATLSDRDEIFADDFVGVVLDTYGNAAWAYELFVNPIGVQADLRRTADGEDAGFDLIFHSEGKITPEGYRVEIAIPFASLRFPDREIHSWRATFIRIHPRGSRAIYSWAATDRDNSCVICQFGTMDGITDVEPGGALDLLPSVVASQTGSLRDPGDPGSEFDEGDPDGELSLGARYAFATGLTAEATLNPDFSQVESDPGLIDVNTTFALFFPERRPFFQEGSDLFDSRIDAVYTRSINDPQAAVKFIGRQGDLSLAYLGARDENTPILLPFEERSFLGRGGGSVSNIVRGRQSFGENSFVGLLATDRRLEDGSGANTVFGTDGDVRFMDNYRADFQLLASRTREPEEAGPTASLDGATFDRGEHTSIFDGESFWGTAGHAGIHREARTWNFDLVYRSTSPTFRAANGFITRNDSRRVYMRQRLLFYPESSSLFDRIQPRLYMERRWNHDGIRKEEYVVPELEMLLAGPVQVDVRYRLANERFRGVEFEGIGQIGAFANTTPSELLRVGGSVRHGDFIARNLATPRLGRGTQLNGFLTLRPTRQLVIEPSVRYSELHDPEDGTQLFEGAIYRLRTSLQFTRELFVRLVAQYDEFDRGLDFEPLVTYRVNPYTMFFVGSRMGYRDFGDARDFAGYGGGFARTSRQFFAKFQYLLRI